MRKFRIGMIVCAIVFIIAHLTFLDYNDLSWVNNTGSYLGLIAMVLLILAMISSQRYENDEKSTK